MRMNNKNTAICIIAAVAIAVCSFFAGSAWQKGRNQVGENPETEVTATADAKDGEAVADAAADAKDGEAVADAAADDKDGEAVVTATTDAKEDETTADPAAELAALKADQELNVRINRSDLDFLDPGIGTIYVTGHRSPDMDTVGSSIAYAALLRKLGYDAQPVVLGKINNESKYVLEAACVEAPPLMEDAAGMNFALVDHSEYLQSADGLQDANVVSIIDHHGDGTVTTANQLIYDARPLGSTATIVWIRDRNYGVEVDPEVAYVMVGSILSDTKGLHSNQTTEADREACKYLSEVAGITDTDAMFQEMFKASISYEGFTDEEIFESDLKKYESAGRQYAIGCVEAYDEAAAEDLAARMKAILPAKVQELGVEMAFAQISVYHDGISIGYLVPSDEAAASVLEQAFEGKYTYDGTSYVMRPGVPRKSVVVPAISDVLASYPRE